MSGVAFPKTGEPAPWRLRARATWVGLVVALLAVGVGLAWLQWQTPAAKTVAPSAAVLEVARTNLVRSEGRWRQRGHDEPFAGWMVEYYPDGSVQSRSVVTNGLLDGVSRGYYTNAQLQVVEHFRAGVSEGVRTKWYADGARQSEAHIAGGKLEGAYHKWHANGVLAEQVEFVSGRPEGVSWSYYASGCRKGRVVFEQGRTVAQQFWQDGEERP